MSEPNLLVCSHRGPFVYRRERGRLSPQRGSGGLIGALAPVVERFGGTWIASALSREDHEIARERPRGIEEGAFVHRFLDLPEEAHRQHYDLVSNEVLWFVFHYLFDLPSVPAFDARFARAWEGYRQVNRIYADAVLSARGGDAILIEDYHLITVGEDVRRRRRSLDVPLLYFHHTPWAEPDYFGLLPGFVLDQIMRAMMAYDVVGFQATRWARAFLTCCERLLPGASVAEDRVKWKGRTVRVLVAPVPLDVPRLKAQASSPPVDLWLDRLQERRRDRRCLVRVDRIELSKNLLRGFRAFESLLERRPELARELWFLALLYPSRPRVLEYRRYLGAALAAVRRINERFGGRSGDEGPVGLYVHDDYHRSLAGMIMSDALLVNPVFDGLNLVAKEGPTVSRNSSALILSRNAGAYEDLGEAAIGVNPFDVDDTASALERALRMPGAERARRAARMRKIVASSTPEGWARGRLAAGGVTF